MIYLDNAATSWPKPACVPDAMTDFLINKGGSPGRSGHRLSIEAARIVFETREALAQLLGAADSRQIIFTANATTAINLALFGWLRPGDHVVVSSMEHNAVLRPLRFMADARGVRVSVVQADQQGLIDPADVRAALTSETRLVCVLLASNASGTIEPVAEIKRAIGDVPLLVDASQAAGAYPIDVERDGIDLLAFTGHKSLLGPMGTGGLYIRPGLTLTPLVFGGTGSASESDVQPDFLPDRYESGTCNAVGLAGLGAAVRHILDEGVERIRTDEMQLFGRLWRGLSGLTGVRLYGPADPARRLATLSLSIAGLSPGEVARALYERYDIGIRAGLHCAQAAHRSIGSFPQGTARLAIGHATSAADVDAAIAAVSELAAAAASGQAVQV